MSGIARTGRIADYLVSAWLSEWAGATVYAALFSTDPFTVQNPTAVEIAGASYARQPITFTLANRLLTSDNSVYFSSLPVTTVVSLGCFDSAFNGNLLWAAPVPGSPIAYPTGGYFSVSSGQYLVGIDA